MKLLIATLVVVLGVLVSGCDFKTYDNSVGYCSFERHGVEVVLYEDHNTSQTKEGVNPDFKKLCEQINTWKKWHQVDWENR